jgi:uncharacterized DUF497 family protein
MNSTSRRAGQWHWPKQPAAAAGEHRFRANPHHNTSLRRPVWLRGLPVSGTVACVQYEWDDGKAAENLRKHGVDFADAIAALEDANRLEEIDTRFAYGEERVQVIGLARDDVLFVIVTLRDEDSYRIISVRKATRHEQDRYYAGDREAW